jgi:hypothetical protein
MSRLKLIIAEGKEARLNPYKRITRGTELNVTVDGVEKVAMLDSKGKYTYLEVGGTDYYITGALEDGGVYETASWEPKAPKAKAEVAEGEAAPAKKSRKKKEVAEEAAA